MSDAIRISLEHYNECERANAGQWHFCAEKSTKLTEQLFKKRFPWETASHLCQNEFNIIPAIAETFFIRLFVD
jgi:hypothetical protein